MKARGMVAPGKAARGGGRPILAGALVVALLLAGAATPALAAGGNGGGSGGAGSAGGTGFTGSVGGSGSGVAGGGGGGGAGGGAGGSGRSTFGTPGTGGTGGTAGSPNGQAGGDAPVQASSAGGGGGGGGWNGNDVGVAGSGAATISNSGALTGGNGGNGGAGNSGSGGGGGGGGAGGYGAIVTGSGASSNSGAISGGNGGAGGASGSGQGGNGGDGGVGVQFTASGTTFTNTGTVMGGTGGAGGAGFPAGSNGAGGAGIVGSGLSITNNGTISGGLGGDGVTRANAITFTGGTNTLTLQSGSTITGNVVANSSADTFALGGGTNSSFDVSQIGATAQYQGFGVFAKTGTSTWTLTGAATTATDWTVGAGTLQLGSGASLVTSSALTVNGGTFDLNGNTQTVASLSGSGGTVTLGSGALTVNQSTSTTYSGAISGSGSLTKTGMGTLILNGVNPLTGLTTVSAGTLEVGDASHTGASIAGNATVGASGTLAGHGTVGGDVINSAGGIVAPGGSIGTLTVSGNYTQGSGSTLQIEVSPTDASKLAVTGTATLAGSLKLVYAPGVYTGTSFTIVSAASVSGKFATVTSNTGSAVAQSLTYGATSVSLLPLGAFEVAPTDDTVFTATGTAALLGGQQANASLLDHLAGQHSGAESGTVRIALAASSDAASPMALAYAGPGQPNDNPLASLPQKMARIGGWFRGVGSFADLSGNANTPGFNTGGGGFLAGIDRPVNDNLTMGVAGGYTRTNLSEDGGSSGAINTTRFALYGSYAFGVWALDASLGYAYDRFSNSRLIASVGEVASSSHDGHELDSALQMSRRFALGGLTVLPEAGLQYVHLYERGFDEAGAPEFNLMVASRNSDSVRPFVGARFVKPWLTDSGVHMALEADIAYSRELSDSPPSLVQVGGGSFTVDGLTPARDQLALGGGITARMNDRLALFADYHATLPTGNLLQQTVKAGLNYEF